MRLINTTTGEFEELIGRNIPAYAILSHTWEDEEVSFADTKQDPRFREKKGWRKISGTCKLARRDGYQYAWIDTCCIDKSSSAELTEAINSMFLWYQRARVCYVFLSDLATSSDDLTYGLQNCRWFTRGWTLQELIAPRHVKFYNRWWQFCGSKENLVDKLATITHISRDVLTHQVGLSSVPVAARMSWASSRETTRIEDIAYCLLGIFGVNLPLLYGEEHRAFRRLQEEIIRTTPDLSILAWKVPVDPSPSPIPVISGVLADSPRCFGGQGAFKADKGTKACEFITTHRGIKIQSTEVEISRSTDGAAYKYILLLNHLDNQGRRVAILLERCGAGQYIRSSPSSFIFHPADENGKGDRVWSVERSGLGSSSGTRYLLTDLQWLGSEFQHEVPFTTRLPEIKDLGIIQVKQPRWATFDRAWPLENYDLSKQGFLFPTSDSQDGVAVLKLRWSFTRGDFPAQVTQFMFVMFYRFPADPENPPPEISLFKLERIPPATLDMLQEMLSMASDTRNPAGLQLFLRYHKIPKLARDTVPIPGTDAVDLVWFECAVVEDRQICENPFWRVEFHVDKVHKDEVPQKTSGIWGISGILVEREF
ncbi:HET-domain-containing protein [Podospora aff. communis PSN243]|uniref:HET-domain-containing protein n=1 Tax=Podospora aff. communis PSN243 TaxID=3040156 RepID=A0AAV9GBM6_9PEZI|nr:HET-domain-containing protein [Podospora aff. communis PSN243]